MNQPPASERRTIWRWQSGDAPAPAHDALAREEPLEIRVYGKSISITMRTPGHDHELAAGFLLSEGLIRDCEDILSTKRCGNGADQNIIDLTLAPHIQPDFQKLTRHVFMSSSCGLCGKASIDAVHAHFAPITTPCRVHAQTLLHTAQHFEKAQPTFQQTGGLHAAAVFDVDGKLLVLREDVGRHNAIDKALGYCLFNDRLPLDNHFLLVSGRASFEILQKALAARLAIIAAVSAPSSLAAQFAHDSNQTLVGFLRHHRMNVYSHPDQVIFQTPS
jgi:FdhD protein